METELRLLVAGFSDRVHENAMKMRMLLDSNRAVFPLAVARVFSDSSNDRGYAYLITILCGQNLLMPLFYEFLCSDTGMRRDGAVRRQSQSTIPY